MRTNSVRKYGAIMKLFFKSQLVWRFDVLLNVVLSVTKILFAYILWSAIFGENEFVSGFTFHTMLSYYIYSSVISGLDQSDGIGWEISGRIRGGTFSKYMVIPADVQGYFGAQAAGAAGFYFFIQMAAACVWIFIFRIQFAVSGDIWMLAGGILMAVLGLAFMVQLNFFIGLLAFKFMEVWIFKMTVSTITGLISGALIPLALMPEAVLNIMRWLPFYYVNYLPAMLMIGRNREEMVYGLAVISMWLLFLAVLNRFMYNKMRVLFDGVGI